ncbi:MAG: hypothetical protein COA43_14720 [Robiginitomaculum sp.]|nr:MAG: hypothetical protein COA43_14720 [Robiginitomaculum sp.]
MASIIYPTTLPDFRTGKARQQQQTFRATQPFSGPLYIQKVTDETPVIWDITVTCRSQIQSRQFQAFIRSVENGELFNKDILTEEGHLEHEVRFIELPLQPQQLSSFLWEYSGVIYARKLQSIDELVDDGLIANWLQDASIIDNALNNLWGS